MRLEFVMSASSPSCGKTSCPDVGLWLLTQVSSEIKYGGWARIVRDRKAKTLEEIYDPYEDPKKQSVPKQNQ